MALLSFYQQTFGDSPRLDFYVRNVHCTASACRSWAENASDVLAVKPMSPGVKGEKQAPMDGSRRGNGVHHLAAGRHDEGLAELTQNHQVHCTTKTAPAVLAGYDSRQTPYQPFGMSGFWAKQTPEVFFRLESDA